MQRKTFLLRALPGKLEAAEMKLKAMADELKNTAGVDNFSIWGVADLLCGYGEYEGEADPVAAIKDNVGDDCQVLCPNGSMRLMYHDIGIVREDKALIRHRVFVTKLKPGCEAEYKRRHDGLIAARGDAVSEGPDSNFTIWNGAGYIFGYCEKVKSFDREMTPEERESTIAWETRQLEIMDWLTDDVDWITGQKHEAIRRVA